MKKTKVLKYNYLPTRIPLWETIILYLLLDKFQASQLVWGIVGTVVVLWWVLCLLIIMFIQEGTTVKELE